MAGNVKDMEGVKYQIRFYGKIGVLEEHTNQIGFYSTWVGLIEESTEDLLGVETNSTDVDFTEEVDGYTDAQILHYLKLLPFLITDAFLNNPEGEGGIT